MSIDPRHGMTRAELERLIESLVKAAADQAAGDFNNMNRHQWEIQERLVADARRKLAAALGLIFA